jgi:Fur family ferric uptake transcriptional regulator
MENKNFQRNTRQRRIILEELQKLKSHPTAAGLYEIVRRRLSKISLGTVYRNLELLSQMRMIQKFEFSAGEARYDGTIEPHDHLRCLQCGRVEDVPGSAAAISREWPEECNGFCVVGHRLEFVGLCAQCRRHPADCNDDASPNAYP